MVVCSWKTVENYLVKILENLVSRASIDWESLSIDRVRQKNFWKISSHISINRNSFWIDQMFLFNQLARNRESIKLDKKFVMIFFKFSIGQELFSIDRVVIEKQSSLVESLLRFSSWFRSIEGYIRSIESCEFWIFTKCFHI